MTNAWKSYMKTRCGRWVRCWIKIMDELSMIYTPNWQQFTANSLLSSATSYLKQNTTHLNANQLQGYQRQSCILALICQVSTSHNVWPMRPWQTEHIEILLLNIRFLWTKNIEKQEFSILFTYVNTVRHWFCLKFYSIKTYFINFKIL